MQWSEPSSHPRVPLKTLPLLTWALTTRVTNRHNRISCMLLCSLLKINALQSVHHCCIHFTYFHFPRQNENLKMTLMASHLDYPLLCCYAARINKPWITCMFDPWVSNKQTKVKSGLLFGKVHSLRKMVSHCSECCHEIMYLHLVQWTEIEHRMKSESAL